MKIRKLASFLMTSLTAGLAAAIVVLFLLPGLREPSPQAPHLNQPEASAEPPAKPPTASGPFSYADAVATAAPAVVNIYTAKITTETQSLRFRDPLLQHFFGRLLPDQTRKRRETSLGSGVIITPDGYLLTNHHVIEEADEIKVVLRNGHNVAVRIIGSDAESDVALLKIDGEPDLPAIPISDPEKRRIGDVVLAIGNPFGVGQTVTMGIVSATGRHHLGINAFENFIQTDAAINPGNSGGALVNARGELVGINTAIFSRSGGSHGIGFAIPFELAEGIMRQLIATGEVVRGWLGIQGQDVTEELAEAFGLRSVEGVLITGVLEDGPGDQAGLTPGDVITSINGIAPKNSHELLQLIAGTAPGKQLHIGGWRGNTPIEATAISQPRPTTSPTRE
ncbi:Periplasmic serine protease, S1-C subfamily [endosymbiont of Ridgeia piscesae]|jgi:serine protease DegS|uniref:Periplasmic serine protease, S1-C subfamily n=3 Tax=endosymbiont of Ridgeia piscesae TaxID=54398 RepID=A0A0T5YUE1_9GAMM|nr:trypsin-like peptidase domain-containing protein [endosymbiont of Ridgeia piscesae]KRT54201.1 Periplasmic serine protease, S1-C subfamily [endosymbiont of Ridgeia piscesae]